MEIKKELSRGCLLNSFEKFDYHKYLQKDLYPSI